MVTNVLLDFYWKCVQLTPNTIITHLNITPYSSAVLELCFQITHNASLHSSGRRVRSWIPSAMTADSAAGPGFGWGLLWTFPMFLFFADRSREERQAEEANDGQIEQQTKQRRTPWIGKCDGKGVVDEPGPACHHVLLHGLHLEVGAQDAADVEELVAVTDVVEAAGCQTLR